MSFIKSFPAFRQLGAMDCGPVCLKIISCFYGADIPIDTLREKCQLSKLGVSLLGISEAAELLGFRTISTKITIEDLKEISAFPCILHWNQNHFVVLYKLTGKYAYISDPAQGKIKLPLDEFLLSWTQKNETGGIVLFLEPTKEFTTASKGNPISKASDWSYLLFHFKKYRKYFLQLLISLVFGSIVLLISPFLIEALVDKGIGEKNLSFVYLILAGQVLLFLGSTFVEIFRNWILLKIGARVTMNLVADFFLKLFQLPLSFFDTHLLGDLILRTNDHKRLETILTTKSLNAIFAIFNLILFGAVLLNYNVSVFFLFFSGSSMGICWVFLFMKQRATLDYKFFDLYGQQQGKMIELLSGVEEIKISNGSRQKRWEWEEIQAKIFKVRVKSLNLDQLQHNGFETIIRFTGIILTVITAKLVIEGEITLGTMFAINMIVGQLTNPIYSLVDFIPAWQDATLALQRIGDVHNQKNEEEPEKSNFEIPKSLNIKFENVSFSYSGSEQNLILKNLNFEIEAGVTTAIVGASGSGKTTLLKLLLKFYKPTTGKIKLGTSDFNEINSAKWRDQCGVVMQGGKIFSDTIVNNIALGQPVDMEQIVMTSAMANLDDFVNSDLPMGYFTKVGDDGLQLSEGQKQRLLLARAIYKNPEFLFLDEATSSLDAKNEREVMIGLSNFGMNKTIVIIAHRLSTVRKSSKILVIKEGEIVEYGTHNELITKRGFYHSLISEQLELGNH